MVTTAMVKQMTTMRIFISQFSSEYTF